MPTADVSVRLRDVAADNALERIPEAIGMVGSTVPACLEYIRRITEQPETQHTLARVKASIAAAGVDLSDGSFERFLLTSVAGESLPRLDTMPLSTSVKDLCRRAFAQYADPRRRFDLTGTNFVAHCKIASLRRFPAGQFDWEPSGLPRSWLPKIRPLRAMWSTLRMVARTGQFGPMFCLHMGTGGRNFALLEREAERSYYRMAQSLALQPEMRGMITGSWLFSSDTYAISPHLSWLTRIFLDNGGIVGTMGPADPSSGVLHRSPERRQAYESGRWKPTVGLVIWPRDAMLAWAARQPDLES